MKPPLEKIGQLIALKRYEQPDGEYFAAFLREFQVRQREELMRRGTVGMFFERLGAWFGDLGRVRWAYAGGAAYVVALAALFFWPREEVRPDLRSAPVVHEVPLAPKAKPAAELDLRSSSNELDEQEF